MDSIDNYKKRKCHENDDGNAVAIRWSNHRSRHMSAILSSAPAKREDRVV